MYIYISLTPIVLMGLSTAACLLDDKRLWYMKEILLLLL